MSAPVAPEPSPRPDAPADRPGPDLRPARAPYRRRRRRDRWIAAVIAVVAVAVGAVVYRTSDIRAVTSDTAAQISTTRALSTVPRALQVAWEQPTDAAVGGVASPYGTVMTTDAHGVTGRDVATGEVRWSYSRSNRDLCAIGSSDTDPTQEITDSGRVHGVMAMYARDGFCGEMVLLDPETGERRYQRTAPNALGGSLVFGGPYAAWVGSDRLEVWRWDLLRTHQYGDQPSPSESNTEHLGCTFLDAAVTDQQFATIEKCPAQGENVRLAINWTDPNAENDDWSVYRADPRADIDTGSPAARIVGITKDRVALLVSAPTPALVIYDADGKVVSRSPASIPAATIAGATGITPRSTIDDVSYSLVGGSLVAVGEQEVTVTVPVTPSTTGDEGDEPDATGFLGTTATSTEPTTTEESRDSPDVRWTLGGAVGLPTEIGTNLLVPTADGLAVVPADDGTVSRTLAVDRTGTSGRVDVQVIGTTIVEVRAGQVVALRATA